MAEYIVDCNKELPEECEYCSPCLKFGCEHVTIATSRQREEIVRCEDCKFSHILSADQWPANRCPELAGRMYCTQWSEDFYGVWTEPNGYCHKGTKR